ncbi:hypothetical protein U4L10_25420, partial [Klebsiella pneumoniae]|nr:hypothetical protein [Klebsiella pneumoniae]
DFAELNKYIKFDENNIHIIEGAGVDRFRFSYQPEPTQNNFSVLLALGFLLIAKDYKLTVLS